MPNNPSSQTKIDHTSNSQPMTDDIRAMGIESETSDFIGTHTSKTDAARDPIVLETPIDETKFCPSTPSTPMSPTKTNTGLTPFNEETTSPTTEITRELSDFKPFDKFPPELLMRTFEFLDGRSLAAAARTCFTFCQVATPIILSSLRLEVFSQDDEYIDTVIKGVDEEEHRKYTTILQDLNGLRNCLRHLSYRVKKGVVLDQDLENEFRDETLQLMVFTPTYITDLETEVQLFDMIVDIKIPLRLKKLTIFFDSYQNEDSFLDRIEIFDTEFLPKMETVKEIQLEWNFTAPRDTLMDTFLILVAIWAEFLDAVPNVEVVTLRCLPENPASKGPRPVNDPIPQTLPRRINHVINLMENVTLRNIKSLNVALDAVVYDPIYKFTKEDFKDTMVSLIFEKTQASIFQVLNKFLSRHRHQLNSFSWSRIPGQETSRDRFREPLIEPLATVQGTKSLRFHMGKMNADIMETLLGEQYFANIATENWSSLRFLEVGHAVATNKWCRWLGKFTKNFVGVETLKLVALRCDDIDNNMAVWTVLGCESMTDLAGILPKKLREMIVDLRYQSISDQGPKYIKDKPVAVFDLFGKLPYLNTVDIVRGIKRGDICQRLSFKRNSQDLSNSAPQKGISYHRLGLAHPNLGATHQNHLKCIENLEVPLDTKIQFYGPDALNYGSILREYEQEIKKCTAGGVNGCVYLLQDFWHCRPIDF
ncbi:hypothetical protein TWF173_010272 [Orbilia oligospora]|nr:hypothetical protein TWF173_010272 [Orbilia oligospora]